MKQQNKFSIGQLLVSGNIVNLQNTLLGIIIKITYMANGKPTYHVDWLYADEILTHRYIDEGSIEVWVNKYKEMREHYKL